MQAMDWEREAYAFLKDAIRHMDETLTPGALGAYARRYSDEGKSYLVTAYLTHAPFPEMTSHAWGRRLFWEAGYWIAVSVRCHGHHERQLVEWSCPDVEKAFSLG